ncbi:MAG: RecX family transcriptional regulator [Bacilli bacterium]|nr:RecX family transcriptional regulator [Bacilli bacterium]
MKIEKFKKLKDGVYELKLDNENIIFTYEEVILKFELLINREIDNKKLKEIEKLNDYYKCYYTAIKSIKKKSYSRKELFKKLKDEFEEYLVNEVLDNIEKLGYIDDKSFANSYINRQITTTNHGPIRIVRDLEDKGIDKKIIEEEMNAYTDDIEKEKIKKLVTKGINSNHTKGNNFILRKLKNDLVYQGFNIELVESELSKIKLEDDSDIREKEYNKIKNKLSRKYSGKELEYKIKEKMAQKGFY